MIKHILLNNLVLVETSEISLTPHFNVVTGETGAGKTALVEAIDLALGARADSALIRKGSKSAFVEVTFDIPKTSSLNSILEEAGLCEGVDEPLVVRREITKEGKNRAFVNCRMVPLPLLQKIGAELIDLIDQSAHHNLRKSEMQRELVDLFGNLGKELLAFQTALAYEKEVREQLLQLQVLSTRREREEAILRHQIEEIEKVRMKEGEEEAVFEKYRMQANSQEISEKLDTMLKPLTESILPQLSRFQKSCDTLLQYDNALSEPAALLREAALSLNEASHLLQSYRNRVDSNPATFQFLENRLQEITQLKRKYGQTFEEITAFYAESKHSLSQLENLTFDLETKAVELKTAQEATENAAKALTLKRSQAAKSLQSLLTEQLQSLNMLGAEVEIEITPQTRHQMGDDQVNFWLKANAGEHPALVKEHSSGGEVSRLLFAIKVVLAEKNNTPTLIFDEIDANVGGKTATIIGEKLKELGKHRQVICITHFPQVASYADSHFAVQKIQEEGRTLTRILPLSKKEKEQELLRMLGGIPKLIQKNKVELHTSF